MRRPFFRLRESRYRRLDALLSRLYQDAPGCPACLAKKETAETPKIPENVVKRGYKVVYNEGKMTPEMLRKPAVRRLIGATASIYETALDAPSIEYEIPHEMRQRLEEDIFLFSGFKTYHQLKEAGELLRDSNGRVKAFGKFYQDVSKIRDKYNRNWLHAEYNFAIGSAQMAAHWAEYQEDKELTNLQYRTALDDKVRPDHAALEGVTLPVDDPFWNTAFPPNGWNCRCHVIPVLKEDYPVSNSRRAQAAFNEMTRGKDAIFRYNPGREGVLFPPHHPYYGKRTSSQEAQEIRENLSKLTEHRPLSEEQKAYRKELQREAIASYKGQVVHNEIDIIITATGIKEFLNQPHAQYFAKNELVRKLPDVIRSAKYIGQVPHSKQNEKIVSIHLFETKLNGKPNYLIARESTNGMIAFYSISDSDEVLWSLKDKKKP